MTVDSLQKQFYLRDELLITATAKTNGKSFIFAVCCKLHAYNHSIFCSRENIFDLPFHLAILKTLGMTV